VITRLSCEVIVVARNQLGTINHTLLTAQSLGSLSPSGSPPIKVVLMDSASPDPSCATNAGILQEFLSPIPLVRLPFLGPRCSSVAAIKRHATRHRRILARVLH
jgi:dethiobiotin synthetase